MTKPKLKLYLLTQTENEGWDTFDSAVVVARDSESARKIHPYTSRIKDWTWEDDAGGYGTWASSLEKVEVEFIGFAKAGLKENSVVCASFNAG